MSVAPAHRTRDSDSTFGPDLGAELVQVVLLPDATSYAPHVQPASLTIGVPPATGVARHTVARRSSRQSLNLFAGHRGYDVSASDRALEAAR